MQLLHDSEPATPVRLDVFLHERLPAMSRRTAQAAIAAGAVRINGRRARKAQLVAAGDVVEIAEEALAPDRPAADAGLALEIVYEDSSVVAVDKPAGVPTHALRTGETATVASFLTARYPEVLAVCERPLEAGIVHRLDNDTSGLLLAARTPHAYEHLRNQFAERHVIKEYAALVHGLVENEGAIRTPIAPDRRRHDRMRTADAATPGARAAATTYRPIQRVGRDTLLAVRISTGVRHQIRVHLAALGHPIVGDTRYGAPSGSGAARQMLHACYLEVDHPERALRLDLRSALPADFLEVMRRLQHGRGKRQRRR